MLVHICICGENLVINFHLQSFEKTNQLANETTECNRREFSRFSPFTRYFATPHLSNIRPSYFQSDRGHP